MQPVALAKISKYTSAEITVSNYIFLISFSLENETFPIGSLHCIKIAKLKRVWGYENLICFAIVMFIVV